MGLTIIKDLPPIVSTRNNTWLQVELSSGPVLEVKISHASVVIVTLKFPVDNSNRVSFNLKPFLQAMGIIPNLIDVHLPEFDQEFPSQFTRNIKAFSVTVSELSAEGTILATGTLNSMCLLAGLNPEYGYTTTIEEFLALDPKRFLTNKPLIKSTSETTQEYLYFYNSDPAFNAGIALRYKLYFDDGTSSGVLTRDTGAFDFSFPAMAILPVGYSQLNIADVVPDRKVVSKYEVFITAGGKQTESHVYVIDRRCDENRREFLFLNSLGGVDTIRIQSVEEISLRLEKELVERFVGMDNSLVSGQYYDSNVNTTRGFKALTHLSNNEERRWLQELFASDRVYEINDGKFLPIAITANSIPLGKGVASYQTVAFDYRYRFDDIGYTRPL